MGVPSCISNLTLSIIFTLSSEDDVRNTVVKNKTLNIPRSKWEVPNQPSSNNAIKTFKEPVKSAKSPIQCKQNDIQLAKNTTKPTQREKKSQKKILKKHQNTVRYLSYTYGSRPCCHLIGN